MPAAKVPLSWWGIDEARVTERDSLRKYLIDAWALLRSRAFFFVVLYQFLTPVISDVSTTAGGLVKNYWAGVQNLQNQARALLSARRPPLAAAPARAVRRPLSN